MPVSAVRVAGFGYAGRMTQKVPRLAVVLGLAFALAGSPVVQAQSVVALSGRVSSTEEGAMEGVMVGATKSGSTITISVVSDARGRFAFPLGRLGAGHYALAVRAVGYELASAASVDLDPHEPTSLDLKLRKTGDLASQLTSAEWLLSMPGTAEQKRPLIECMSCHTLERIVRSKYGADELFTVLERMPQYANNSTSARPQPRGAQGCRLPRDGQSERRTDLVIRAPDSCTSQRTRDPRGRHRICVASPDHRAA
jgi:hypothetical protein